MRLSRILSRDRILMFLAAPMAFLSPVLATLFALHVSPFAPGASVFVLLTFAAGCLVGLLSAGLIDRHGIWKVLHVLLITFGIAIAADLSVLGQKYMTATFEQTELRVGMIVLFLLVVFALVWLMRKNMPLILFVISLSLLATTLATSRAHATEPKPPTIYIIMDEMIGLNGIDRTLPGGQEAYDLTRSVFENHGFRIYARAFSRHFFTKVSIPAILNFDETEDGVELSRYTDNEEHLTVTENALFDGFVTQGLPVDVYQSGHVNFCTKSVSRCHVYPSFNAESQYTSDIDPEVVRKANIGIIRSVYLKSYFVAPLLPFFSDVADEPDLDDHPAYFDLHGFNAWFDEFSNSLTDAKPGSLSFAHFLMPHGPSILDENCQTVSNWESPYYLKEQKELAGAEFERERARFYEGYFKQMRCGVKKLDTLLTAIDKDPNLKPATIVIHGDHGSRISSGKFVENAGPQDMLDNYSAFYAIRKSGVEPGVDLSIVSVQRLTKLHFSGLDESAIGEAELSIMIHSKDNPAGVKAAMPTIP